MNELQYFRKLFGLPACPHTGIAWCEHIKSIKVDGQLLHFCSNGGKCPPKEKKDE
jgi:hypothetical protein